MYVRLLHYSHLEGSAGVPGDVVFVDDKIGEQWIKSKGAVLSDPPAMASPEEEEARKPPRKRKQARKDAEPNS